MGTFRIGACLWAIGGSVLLGFSMAYACAPLPILLYPADEVYRSRGLEIPALPADAVAYMNGKYISQADFKEWLYGKIGFTPELRQTFVVNQSLKKRLQSNGIDTDLQKEIISENFLHFEARGVFRSCADWDSENRTAKYISSADYRWATKLRVERSYLLALYVMENWKEIYRLGLKEFGIERDIFDIQGDDEKTKHIIRLNNAYEMLDYFATSVAPHIRNRALSKTDLNLPDPKQTHAFKEWLFSYYSTAFLLENYLGMLVAADYAETHQLTISDRTIQTEMKLRTEVYQLTLDAHKKTLPKKCTALELSPVYTEFILSEVRDDLKKSKACRNAKPLQADEVELRFHEQYGYEGQQCEVRDLYKWVRKRTAPARNNEHAAAVAAQAQNELNTIREELEHLKTLAEGGTSFEALTEAHSDHFDLTQGNISKTYQAEHGFQFAKEINSIPDGGLKIIQSENGIHLIQVVSRVTTPYTDEIKEQIVQQYRDELVSQDERYALTKKLFYKMSPYFKQDWLAD